MIALMTFLMVLGVFVVFLLPRPMGNVQRVGLRETVRGAGVRIWKLVRYWGIGLPQRLAELLLPPHIVCPPAFEHLSLEQWRDNAKEYFARDDDGLGWCGREGKTIFEWLAARNLPPVPRDKYCPEKRKWVKDMNRDERAAYLKELRRQGA